MKQISKAPVFGMITDVKPGRIGGYGEIGYQERAEHAKAIGESFVSIVLTPETAVQMRSRGSLQADLWDGNTMQRIAVPAQDLKVVYTFASSKVTGSDDYKDAVRAFADAGVRFVNSPETIWVCDDKVISQQIFDRVGVPTPQTMDYTRENAKMLLEESGFIFIKEVYQSMGEGQATITAHKGIYLVNIDGNRTEFASAEKALDLVDVSLNGACIVQEGIRMPRVMGRVYDFRMIMQRDGMGQIVMPAIYARIGAEGLDQSNVSKGGQAQELGLFRADADDLRAEFRQMGKKIFDGVVREGGEVGEIGIDFLVSEKGRILVLEVNGKPGTDGNLRDIAVLDRLNPALTLRDRPIAATQGIADEWKDTFTTLLRNSISYARHMADGA